MIEPHGRYRDVLIRFHRADDGQVTRYFGRRFPAPPALHGAQKFEVHDGDRPDLVAARTLGDPLAFWRIAELNLVLDPWTLTAVPGAVIRLPAPGGTFRVAG